MLISFRSFCKHPWSHAEHSLFCYTNKACIARKLAYNYGNQITYVLWPLFRGRTTTLRCSRNCGRLLPSFIWICPYMKTGTQARSDISARNSRNPSILQEKAFLKAVQQSCLYDKKNVFFGHFYRVQLRDTFWDASTEKFVKNKGHEYRSISRVP